MDQNKNSHVIAQFRLKYSSELADSEKFRRKFSSQFKIELLQALEVSQLTQREFSEAIGISLSVISKCRKHFEFKTPIDHDVNEHSFHQIKIEPHFRADSAYCNEEVIRACFRHGAPFSITAAIE